MAVQIYAITTNEDDGYSSHNSGGCQTFTNGLEPAFGWTGNGNDESFSGWWRVPAVALDQAEEVEEAFFVLRNHDTFASLAPGLSITGNFYGIDEDNHTAPSSKATWDTDHGLHTTAYVPVTWPLLLDDTYYYAWLLWFTPNLAPIVNEITARALWASTNNMGFHLDHDGTVLGVPTAVAFRDANNTLNEPAFVIVEDGEIWPSPHGLVMCYSSHGNAFDKHMLPYPPETRVNEVVYAAVCADGAKTVTWPAGWTELAEGASGTAINLSVGYHKIDGTEDESFMITLSASDSATAIIWRVKNCADPATAAPEVSSIATGTSTAPDPPAITPSSSKKWLEMVIIGHDATSVSADPSGFVWTNANLGAYESLSIGWKWVETDAEINEAAWTLAASQEWAVCVVLVPPAASPNHYAATKGAVWGVAG